MSPSASFVPFGTTPNYNLGDSPKVTVRQTNQFSLKRHIVAESEDWIPQEISGK